jgi:hypothetical protein
VIASGASATDVAAYMKRRLGEEGDLYQEVVVYEIQQEFGDQFVYTNDNGNLAIASSVLAEFRKITPDAVWVRSERYWRRREESDEAGSRMQD